jgi:hypothetical protein
MKLPALPAILLSAFAAVGAWNGYTHFVLPPKKQAAEFTTQADAMRARTEAARRTISEIHAKEPDADLANAELGKLDGQLPSGAAMIWLPELLKTHFGGFGITVPLIRLNTIQDDPELAGYSRGYWSLAVPIDGESRNTPTLLLAVAELEQQSTFLKVLDFDIRPNPEQPDGRLASLNVSVLFRK